MVTVSRVTLPRKSTDLGDLSVLQSSGISLSRVAELRNPEENDTPVETDPVKQAQLEKQNSLEKLARFKESVGKSQRAEGVVENGFEVATDFLRMQKELSASKKEMETLQDRMEGLERELNEVRELIAFNPV
ncbi:hypothetical protein BGW41_004521 [Actinomortierella wolfii]|nr:hypothetical protein BGW41_004521 [Actinomortierella wolfii]